jgi:PASTA domain-containing protein
MYDSSAFDTDAFDDGSYMFELVMVSVPDVVGETQAAAVSAIQSAGLVAQIQRSYSDTVPAGEVISQNPAAASEIEEGSTVIITVSRGIYVPGTHGFIGNTDFIGWIQ